MFVFLYSFGSEAADLLQKLSLDSQAKTHDAVEATKKVENFPFLFLLEITAFIFYMVAQFCILEVAWCQFLLDFVFIERFVLISFFLLLSEFG